MPIKIIIMYLFKYYNIYTITLIISANRLLVNITMLHNTYDITSTIVLNIYVYIYIYIYIYIIYIYIYIYIYIILL